MKPGKILIIDDEKDIRSLMSEIFEEEGYQVSLAANGQQARESWLNTPPDIVFLDIWMPDIDGISLLKEMAENGALNTCSAIMMSGHGTIETAIEATKIGAYDFLEKPLSLGKLLVVAERAQNHNRLHQENKHLKQNMPDQCLPIGKSKLAVELRETIQRLANYSMNILITGEHGTGKHHAAMAIHKLSERKNQAICEINGLDFDEQAHFLLGEKTEDATFNGELIQYDGGSLILSNTEHLTERGQAFLMQLLTKQTFCRINCDLPTPINLRVFALSLSSIDEAVKKGTFRQDLAQKLSHIPLTISPLRQHTEDVPEIVDYFVDYFMNHEGFDYREFPLSVKNILRQHRWNGNFLELKNTVQRLLIMGSGEVTVDEITLALESNLRVEKDPSFVDTAINLKLAKEKFESAYLSQLLRECGGSVSQTAKRSGIERTNLYRKLKTLGIDPKEH